MYREVNFGRAEFVERYVLVADGGSRGARRNSRRLRSSVERNSRDSLGPDFTVDRAGPTAALCRFDIVNSASRISEIGINISGMGPSSGFQPFVAQLHLSSNSHPLSASPSSGELWYIAALSFGRYVFPMVEF